MPRSASRSLTRRAFLAAFALAGLTACGTSNRDSSVDMACDVPGPLRFEAPILGGGTLDGASLAGQAVLLWFWAPT